MKAETVINSSLRETSGTSSAKKLRAQGYIPAVVYGHNFQTVSLSLSSSDINKLFKSGSEGSEEYHLYKLVIDHRGSSQDIMVMVKNIQRHPVRNTISHIDFFAVKLDEEIVAPVHIKLVGKSVGVKAGGIQRQILREIEVKSLPANIPPHFELDVTELDIGDSLHVSDIAPPDNLQILGDVNAPIVNIMAPTVHAEDEEAAEEAEAPAEEQEAAADQPAEEKS